MWRVGQQRVHGVQFHHEWARRDREVTGDQHVQRDDKSYWHYEAFASGGDGASPFIARMTVSGRTWTYDGKAGKMRYRVSYHYESATKVTLRIEESADETHWTLIAQGEGRKQLR